MCKNGKNAQKRKFRLFGNKKRPQLRITTIFFCGRVKLTRYQSEKSHGTPSFGLQQIMAISSRT